MKPINQCIVIPAAGASSRLGRPKQLVEFEGESLVRRAAKTALEAASNVIIITGCERDAVTQEVGDLPVFVADNPEWAKGMGKSIAVGVQAAIDRFQNLKGVLVLLCDTPLIDSVHLRKLLDKGEETELVLSEYEETNGVPAYFGEKFFDRLVFLDSDQGARSFLGKDEIENSEKVSFRGRFVDVDLPEDLTF